MSEILKHLVIIEPTEDQQIALERALVGARVRDSKPELRLFLCVDGDSQDLKATNPKLYRDLPWLESLTRRVEEEGLQCSMELCWSTEWEQAVLECAERYQPFHIFMPDCEQGRKRGFFSVQQWALLRHSKWPVTIVRPGKVGNRRRMLAAVNIQKEDDDPRYARLNQKILTEGKSIANSYGAEFFVINAYPDSLNYPDREQLMKRSGLPTQNVHVEQGPPDDVIADYAKQIGADTVVIGTLARRGALALMKGNTSEKVLRKLDQDVIAYS